MPKTTGAECEALRPDNIILIKMNEDGNGTTD
jgi:hypothetical protein